MLFLAQKEPLILPIFTILAQEAAECLYLEVFVLSIAPPLVIGEYIFWGDKTTTDARKRMFDAIVEIIIHEIILF